MQIEVARLFLLLIPTTLHICVKKMQSQKAFAIYSAYFVSHFFHIEPSAGRVVILFICLYIYILRLLKRVQESFV